MKKSSKEYSPKVGIVIHGIVAVVASYILVSLVVGKMAFHNETIGTIVPLLLTGVLIYLGIKVYKYVNLLRGATVPVTAVESSESSEVPTREVSEIVAESDGELGTEDSENFEEQQRQLDKRKAALYRQGKHLSELQEQIDEKRWKFRQDVVGFECAFRGPAAVVHDDESTTEE